MSALLWAVPAPDTIRVSLGVEISDNGSGGPEDEQDVGGRKRGSQLQTREERIEVGNT